MPRLGGLAIYNAFMIAAVASLELTKDIVGNLLGGSVLANVGVLDDKYQLPAKVKRLGQIFAACGLTRSFSRKFVVFLIGWCSGK